MNDTVKYLDNYRFRDRQLIAKSRYPPIRCPRPISLPLLRNRQETIKNSKF